MASILVFGPHPDDQELGMGGSVARLVKQGHAVHLVDVTTGEPTPLGSEEQRGKEKAKAAEILGVERTLVGLPNRRVTHDLESRHKVAAIIRKHRPNWMFVPFPIDAHPDHVAVTRICEDARFDAKLTKTDIPGEPWYPKRIIYYYCTHLRMSFQPTFCIDITAEMDQKLESIARYKSQFTSNAAGDVPAQVKVLNGYFGTRIATPYAEPFFTHEVLGLSGLSELV